MIWEFFIFSLNMSLKHELAFHKKIYTPNFPRKEWIAVKAGNTFPEQRCTLQEQLHLAGSVRGVWWLRLLRNRMPLRRYWTMLRTLVCCCFLRSLRGVLLVSSSLSGVWALQRESHFGLQKKAYPQRAAKRVHCATCGPRTESWGAIPQTERCWQEGLMPSVFVKDS